MTFRKLTTALAAAALLLSGCGTTNGTATPGVDEDAYSIGYVAFDMATQLTVRIWDGVQDTADENGWTATVIDATGSADKAIAAIQTLVQKDVDIIFTGVFPSAALSAGLESAKAAGIPVASFGGGVGDGVQTDWSFGNGPGTATGEEVLELTDGEGALLMLGYKPGLPCQQREDNFLAAIEGENTFTSTRQEIQIPGAVESGTKYTQAWLASNPQGSAPSFTVWACTDDAAIGALAAVQQAGRDDIRIVSIDGGAQVLSSVADGDIAAVAWIDGYSTGVEGATAIPEIIERGVDATPVEGDAPFQLVDTSNVDEFLAEHPDAVG